VRRRARRLGRVLGPPVESPSRRSTVGPRHRQRQNRRAGTAPKCRRAGPAMARAGRPLEELDEYDLAGLLDRLAPAPRPAGTAAPSTIWWEPTGRSLDESERIRTFQRMFERLLTQLAVGAGPSRSSKSWSAFPADRVGRGLRRITEGDARGTSRLRRSPSGGFHRRRGGPGLLGAPRTGPALELSLADCGNGSLTHSGVHPWPPDPRRLQHPASPA